MVFRRVRRREGREGDRRLARRIVTTAWTGRRRAVKSRMPRLVVQVRFFLVIDSWPWSFGLSLFIGYSDGFKDWTRIYYV